MSDRPQRADTLIGWLMAYKASDALCALQDWGILDRLAAAPASPATLAREFGLVERYLVPLLGVATAAGAIAPQDDGTLSLSEEAVLLAPLMALEARLRRWHDQHDTLANVLRGLPPRDPMAEADAELRTLYNRAMAGFTRGLAATVVRLTRLPRGSLVVDVGGSDGSLAFHLARLVPDGRVTVVDRPDVAPHFHAKRNADPGGDRTDFLGCDLRQPETLAPLLAEADCVVASNVLHMLDAEVRDRFLGLAAATMKPGARMVVYDQFPHHPAPGLPFILDMASLMVLDWLRCGVSFDQKVEDVAFSMRAAGFAATDIHTSPSAPGHFIVASAGPLANSKG